MMWCEMSGISLRMYRSNFFIIAKNDKLNVIDVIVMMMPN